ncbi:MAG: hypothetical protein II961_01120 [Candidatus Riflebacteria bacterium]|jgi:hypothetical protein|nr:hypothetical protein [Candidatus Riflebacteria bacterium]
MKFSTKLLLLILCLFQAQILLAEKTANHKVFLDQKLEVFGLGGTPWEEGSYESERGRAWMDAMHHAYEQILSLTIMDGKEVKHVLHTNKALKERLGMILMSAPKTFYQKDVSGLVRCKLEIPISGKLSLRSAFYLAALRPQPMQPTGFLASWSSNISVDETQEPSPYKRIVIDARKFDFIPALFPRFFDEQGNLLFQEAMIPQAERFSRPVVLFATNMITARANLEEKEVFTLSSTMHELHKSDIIVKNADLNEFKQFCNDIIRTPLKQREIMIVYNPDRIIKKGAMKKTEIKEESDKNKK